MWCVVLGILATTVFVVVLDQVFKEGRIEVVFLSKNALKAKLCQRIDDCAAEAVPLRVVSYVLAYPIKQSDLCATIRFYSKDVIVADGDGEQGIVEKLGKLRRILAIV